MPMARWVVVEGHARHAAQPPRHMVREAMPTLWANGSSNTRPPVRNAMHLTAGRGACLTTPRTFGAGAHGIVASLPQPNEKCRVAARIDVEGLTPH